MTHNFGRKILLVDDEPNIVLALEFLLQRQGYTVQKAFDGFQAIEIAQLFQPDGVVLDVMMPGIDGFEVARHLRHLHGLENLRIIFLTAKGTESDKQMGYISGGEYYLVKPFDNEEFVRIVGEMVEYEC